MSLTLEDLEKRLLRLEHETLRDQLATNAYTINPNGEVEEKLTGRLEAKGITLAAAKAVTPQATIEWTEGPEGAKVATINAFYGGDNFLDIVAQKGEAYASLGLIAADTGGTSELALSVQGPEGQEQNGVTLLDSDGLSAFYHTPNFLAGSGRSNRINVGEGVAVWKEGIGGITIAHGLGVTPIYANAVLLEGDDIFYDTAPIGLTSLDETNFTFAWTATNEVTINAGESLVRWIAIG